MRNLIFACLLTLGLGVGFFVPALGEPRISEFLASNVTGLKDEDGAEPDWIEIYNPDGTLFK